MMKSRGNNAQFTYDFGIAIAQSTVNKITRLTGATLTLASAFYALKSTANEYVNILKENTLKFGGVLSTMKAMEQAQNRLIKGQSYFSVDDQLRGMQQLMSIGIDVGENLEWINKAAHATGKSYAEFSGMIASAIQGNSQALVDAGLITQRAVRIFDKYEANTIMRQNAILNFVKNHKGLMSAIRNDFETIQDQMLRMKSVWKGFLSSIVGKPNDPQSLYGQVVSSMKMVANALAGSSEQIKKYGFIIGQVLGWVVKQVGHLVLWLGRQTKKVLDSIWKVTDDFQNQARSLLVWLEFWKLKIIDFFKTYSNEIKTLLKLFIAYKALKGLFIIGKPAITSVIRYKNAISDAFKLQKRYLNMMGPLLGNKVSRWFQSLAVFMPRGLRKIWVKVGKFFERGIFGGGFSKFFKSIFKSFFGLKPLFGFLVKGAKMFFGFIKNMPAIFTAIARAGKALMTALFSSNPVGWIILAITLLTTLYIKSEKFRVFINGLFKFIWEGLKIVWNSLMYGVTLVMVGCKKIWKWFKTYVYAPVANFFKSAWTWIGDMWSRFKDSSVGQWIDRWIVTPLKNLFQWLVDAWNWVIRGISRAVDWISGGNDKIAHATKDLANANDVPVMPTIGGGKYESNNGTNHINPYNYNWGVNIPHETESAPFGNPMLVGAGSMGSSGTNSKDNSTNMTFTNGAIQIVVQKGDSINEHLLAQQIRLVLNDIKREGDIRGGVI